MQPFAPDFGFRLGRMPFDTPTFQLLFFLGLINILASLPAEPYFHPWHDGTPYRISHGSYVPEPLRKNEAKIEVQVLPVFSQRNVTRSRGDSGVPKRPTYGLVAQERWYQVQERGRAPQEFPGQLFRRHSSAPVDEYLGSESYGSERYDGQNIGNAYSSHVNCQLPNQNKGEGETIRENIEPIFGSESSGNVNERINFEDGSRALRTGTAREEETPHPRIITPNGSNRRPSPGSSIKNQSKPFNHRATNTIPTTEKTFRNQTRKESKRPRPKPQGGDIVFPDGDRRQKFTPRVTKCRKKSTFCDLPGEEYPDDYISQVLKKEGAMFREFFGKDVISDPNITERINAPEENSLCPYRQEVVYPRAAQNKENKWLFVVNQDQYVQGVTVEVCLNPESRCILTEGFPLGYTPYCKQKYIERRLVALGEDGKPHTDSFRLPSCCSCVVKHETSARMALVGPARETHSLQQPTTPASS